MKKLKKKTDRRSGVFYDLFDFFKWYLWILVIGIVLGNWIYTVVRQDLEHIIATNRAAVLEQNSRIVDIQLSAINELIYTYENSFQIMSYGKQDNFATPESISKGMKVRQAIQDEGTYLLENDKSVILDHLIYYENSDRIITKNIIEKKDVLLEQYMVYPEAALKEIKQFISEENAMRRYLKATTINYYGEEKDIITYMHQMQSKEGERIYSITLIDVEKIYSGIKETLTEGSYYTIYFEDTPVVTLKTNGEHPKQYEMVEHQEHVRISESSDYMQMSQLKGKRQIEHAIFEPRVMIKAALNDVNRVFVVTACIYLLIGGGVALLFTGQNYKEVRELFKGLKGSSIRNLTEGTKQIIQKNNELHLQNEMRRYRIKNNLYKMILRGQLTDREEIKRQFSEIDEPIPEEETTYFQVISILGTIQPEVIQQYLDEVGLQQEIHSLEKIEWGKRIIYILNYGEVIRQNAVVTKLFEVEALVNKTKQTICIGVGSTQKRIEALHKSYSEAKCVAQIRSGQSDYPLLYTELITKEQELYYPEEIENKLINAVLTGDHLLVEEMLEMINQENRRLIGDLLKCLKYQQIGTLSKIMMKVNKVDETLRIQMNKRIKYMLQTLNHEEYIDIREDIEDCLKECYFSICERVERKKQEKADQIKDDIMKYIEENMTDSELCMNKITDVFDVSRGYLSKVIKEYTNKNFSTYVEEYRMELASNMIKNTQLPIYVIAEKVGYYSSGTFCRAYKRKYGISPNQLREEVS